MACRTIRTAASVVVLTLATTSAGLAAPLRTGSLPIVETQHSIYASVKAVADADWQGTVTFDHSVTFQGRRQLRHSARATVQLWRRLCDLGGCIETDLSVSAGAAPQQTWAPDVTKGDVTLASVAVHIDRYRVHADAYEKLDSVVVHVPLALSVTKSGDKFQQALVANTPTVSTTSVTRQVLAAMRLTLGDMRLDAPSATASASIITTSMRR